MKNRILSLVLFLGIFYSISSAQTKHFVNAELLGTHNLVGLSFDSRFGQDLHFGYKIGFGYGYQKHEGNSHINLSIIHPSIDAVGKMFNCYSAPVNIHYMLGKEKHFFEVGLGLTLFATDYSFKNNNSDRFGYYSFARIAYRFEPIKTAMLLSIGVDMPFYTPGSGLHYTLGFTPAITVGYRL